MMDMVLIDQVKAQGIAKAAAMGAIGGGRFKYGAKAVRQVGNIVQSTIKI